jgi:Heterokaryon incompatibility protein (HET)
MIGHLEAFIPKSHWTLQTHIRIVDPMALKYGKLDPDTNQIRVLELLPSRWSEKISCKIRTISLDDKPVFEALSYVWGNPEDTDPINVDDAEFQATKNLIKALKRLRSSNGSRTIWVDAVCINQKDFDERAQQVGIMHLIYEKASSVQVFLGESGILDVIPVEEQNKWDDPPCRAYWHRDGTQLVMTRSAPNRAAVRLPIAAQTKADAIR